MNLRNTHLFMKNSLLLAGAFLLLSLAGCEKDAGPLTSDSVIRGDASLFFLDYSEPINIHVTVTGPYGQKSTDTDASGNFLVDGLDNGTYYVDFSQEGYGTLRQYGIQLLGGDTIRVHGATLFKLPQGDLARFVKAYTAQREDHDTPANFVCIETNLSELTSQPLQILIYMNTTPDVAWNNYECYYPATDVDFAQVNVLTIYINPDALPFVSNTKVYLRGYPCNVQEYIYGFLDTYLGEKKFSTLDKSRSTEILSFIMP
jgi:hypothetical protein